MFSHIEIITTNTIDIHVNVVESPNVSITVDTAGSETVFVAGKFENVGSVPVNVKI